MGNQTSSRAWHQPDAQEVEKYATKADPLYENCPQKIEHEKLVRKLSNKAMMKVQKRILAEYPYLSTIKESMVVTDNTLPDCPIIYANDDFERLTLYPKEEIIGRNCRFLQGRYTNKETVKKIHHAIQNGLPLDVEIFNYRKDGSGFFNNFLLLPVHKSKESCEATHFIAIQKDITLIRKEKNAQLWSPPECAMWLEHLQMNHLADLMVENDIDGKTLMTLNGDDLVDLGVESKDERKVLLQHISKLLRRPEAAYRVLSEHSKGSEPTVTFKGAASEVCLENPQNQEIWSQQGKGNKSLDKTCGIKCYFRDEIVIFSGEPISWSQINKMVESKWHIPLKFKCVDTGNKIKNSSEWKKVLKKGHVLLQLSKKERAIPEFITKAYDLLCFLVVIVDWEGTILFVNKASSDILGKNRDDLAFLPCTRLFPGIELKASKEWKKLEAKGKKLKTSLMTDISMYDQYTYLVQGAPLVSV